MRALSLLVVLSGSWVALAAPSRGLSTSSHALSERQARNAPPPCERADPEPTEEETKERFDKFANAFIVTKNITEAFEYIAEDYIVSLLLGEGATSITVRRRTVRAKPCQFIESQPTGHQRCCLRVGNPQPDLARSQYHSPGYYVQRRSRMATLPG